MEEKNEAQRLIGNAQGRMEQGASLPSATLGRMEHKQDNVGALVAKSKKAASSLWTLLHAKTCKLAVNRCSHPGCAEAKLMYLHLKTCSAKDGARCPSNRKGCEDARKLLLHYRRCRDIRCRQAASRSRTVQHVCLVCSLVARHVKGSIDRSRSTSPKGQTRSHLIPALNLSSDSRDFNQSQRGCVRPRPTSNSGGGQVGGVAPNGTGVDAATVMKFPAKMPPPPPRFPFSNPLERQTLSNVFNASTAPTLAVNTGLYSEDNRSTGQQNNPAYECPPANSWDGPHSQFRPRAESLDAGSASSELWREPNPTVAGNSISPVEATIDEDRVGYSEDGHRMHRRQRSASCNVPLSSGMFQGGFAPIMEEPVGEDLQKILEGDL